MSLVGQTVGGWTFRRGGAPYQGHAERHVARVNVGGAIANFGSGHHQFRNENSGRCAGVIGASHDRGAHLVQWTCEGQRDHQWALTNPQQHDGQAYYEVRNLNSGMCLGVIGASHDQGAQLVQWPCEGQRDHRRRVTLP